MKNDPSRAESTFQQCSCRPIQILQTAEHLAMDRVPQVPLTRALHHQGSTYAGYVQRDIQEGVDEDHISNCGAHLANPPQHSLEQPMLQRDPNGMGRKKPLTCPGCTHILAANPLTPRPHPDLGTKKPRWNHWFHRGFSKTCARGDLNPHALSDTGT